MTRRASTATTRLIDNGSADVCFAVDAHSQERKTRHPTQGRRARVRARMIEQKGINLTGSNNVARKREKRESTEEDEAKRRRQSRFFLLTKKTPRRSR